MYTDFVIQLKNAALARKKSLQTPYANIRKAIAKTLVKEGFLETVKVELVEGKKMLTIALRYQKRKPSISDVAIVSKPSLRVYVTSSEIGAKQGKSSVAIISTSSGVMSGKEAMKKGIGGELLFRIW